MTTALNLPDLEDKQDWTVDDVAKLPEDLHYELIDGRLILSPSPLTFHQFVSRKIANALEQHSPADYMAELEMSVMIDGRNEPRPDVVVLKLAGATRTPVLAEDVLVVVEIISPGSTTRDRRDKLKLYAYGGIPAYWIIDPLGERITFTQLLLGPDGTYHQQVRADDLITVRQPWNTTLDIPAWERQRDRINQVGRPNR